MTRESNDADSRTLRQSAAAAAAGESALAGKSGHKSAQLLVASVDFRSWHAPLGATPKSSSPN